MPTPKINTTLRPDLSVCAVEYAEALELIGLSIFPEFPVEEKKGKYPVIPVEALFNIPETQRAPRTNYARDDYEFELADYNTEENGVEGLVDDVEAEQYSKYFDAEQVSVQRVTNMVVLNRERHIATTIFNPAVFTPHEVNIEWSNPQALVHLDIMAGLLAVRNACGAIPNKLVISQVVLDNLKSNVWILDRVKYTLRDAVNLSPQQLAAILNIEEILVGQAVYNVAKKGQEASLTQIWSDEYAMLCVSSSNKDIRNPSIGRTFKWVKDCPENVMVESYRKEEKRCTIIRARQFMQEQLMLVQCGYLFTNITE
jgi:hypothetical protein